MRLEGPRERRRTIAAGIVLTVATIAVYWRVVGYGFVIYDDLQTVAENVNVQQGITVRSLRWAFITAAFEADWHPLTYLSHMIDYRLFGGDAGGHHLVNVLLHVINALLLFAVAMRMTGSRWKSFLVAALFSLHPLHVESVAWVSERKDVLSTLFWMLTLGAYVRHAERPTRARYGQMLCFFALGLLSKPMVVSLPFVLLLLDYWPLGRLRSAANAGTEGRMTLVTRLRGLLLEKVPLFALAALVAALTVVASLETGVVRSLDSVPLGLRLATAVVSYGTYIRKMLVPLDLFVLYPYPESRHWAGVGVSLLLLLGISWWGLRSARRAPWLIVGWLWYLGTLVPVIGLLQTGNHAMADRYTYLPLVGLFVAMVWGLPDMIPPGRRTTPLYVSTATIVLLSLASLAWRQTGNWESSVTLFARAAQAAPEHYLPPYHLAIALELSGDIGEAVKHYERSVSLNPKFADGHSHLGVAYIKQERYNEAVASFLRALEADPGFVPARNNLRKLQLLMGHSL